MSSISSQRLRDTNGAESDDGWSPADNTPAGFDYAKLLRARTAPHRPVARTTQTAQTPQRAAQQQPDAEEQKEERPATLAHRLPAEEDAPLPATDNAANRVLGSRVAHAAGPIVSSVFARQQRVLDLVGTLAREIAGFCSDAAIANAGNWDVQMPLDEHLFPHTTLYLTLSRFIMQLRFDAADPEIKQLLLDHSSMLERELDATLRAWGESRDIQLTVW
ncbi:type III secretion system protein SctP [Paraburkholderia phosphatilytica]|uniref:type III secretion system protein SctP n=1 Tax=Paraburkholderia phosphatilytica TaxID=2282883 RepID=UPI000E532F9D|nr:type III secretion system protein SctP [Paraburkholderia phosphatilytica]